VYLGLFRAGGHSRGAEVVVITGGGHPPTPFVSRGRVLPEAELESLMDAAPSWSKEFGVSPGLVAHAIREAKESRLLGDSPETWSPLASATRFDELGRWRAQEELAVELARLTSGRDQQPTASFDVGFGSAESNAVVSLEVAGERAAAFAFDSKGFAVPFPESIDALEISVVDDAADDRTWSELGAALPDGDRQTVVVWRVYSGENSWMRDVVSSAREGVHRLTLRGLEGAGVVVGRALRVVNKRLRKIQGDPFMRRRLALAELHDQKTSEACPRITDLPSAATSAVVVVHGTMSTALPLAGAVRATAGDGQRCLRYEHDTWMTLEAHAEELAGLITEHVRDTVVLIAHSRGGLVAARAAQILGAKRSVRVAGLLTLGTPFAGTPLALAARAGSLGMTSVMGGLRFLGGPVVDAGTRIAGLVLRVDPPPGLTVMNPTSDALPILRQYLPQPATTIAGTADPSADRYGAALITGVGRGAFSDQPNDLIVSVASALVENTDHVVVASDHFSYVGEPAVSQAMCAIVRGLPLPSSKPPVRSEDETLMW